MVEVMDGLPVAVDAMGGDRAPTRWWPVPVRPPENSAYPFFSLVTRPVSASLKPAFPSSRPARSSKWTKTLVEQFV